MSGDPSASDRYREYWAYLRHIEGVRFQMTTAVSVVVVAALGAMVGEAPWGPNSRLDAWQGLAVVGALQVLVGCGGMYLVAHKENYNWYYGRLKDLDPGLKQRSGKDVFGWLLGTLTLLQAALAISGIAMSKLHCASWWTILLGLAFVLPWWGRYKGWPWTTRNS